MFTEEMLCQMLELGKKGITPITGKYVAVFFDTPVTFESLTKSVEDPQAQASVPSESPYSNNMTTTTPDGEIRIQMRH